MLKFSHHPDIHIKNDDAYRYFREELHQIIEYYMYREMPDVMVFNGDLMDDIYDAGSPACKVLIEFMTQLVRIAHGKENQVRFRVVRGTTSHDGEQLDVLKPFSLICDFKIIDDVYDETINGQKIRYAAEKYCVSYEEFQERVFHSPCDCLFYHGSVEGALPIIENYGKTVQLKNHVIMKLADIEANVSQFTALGHIHPRTFIKKNVFYSGSYGANSFADAGHKKGFDIISSFKDTGDIDIDFVENKNKAIYEIVDITDMVINRGFDICKVRVNEILRRKKSNQHIRLDADLTNAPISKIDLFNMIKVKFPQFKYKTIKRPVEKAQDMIDRDAEIASNILNRHVPLSVKFADEIERSMSQDDMKYLFDSGSELFILDGDKYITNTEFLARKFLEDGHQYNIEK